MSETESISSPALPILMNLHEQGMLSDTDVEKVERLIQRDASASVPHLLLDLGLVSEGDLASSMSWLSDCPLISGDDIPEINPLENLPHRFLKQHSIAGISSSEDQIGIAVVDPLDRYPINALSMALNKKVVVHVGVRSELEKAVERQCEDKNAEIHEAISDVQDIEHLRDIASEAPVIRYVNLLFQKAADAKASDIHIQSTAGSLNIRLRIDGMLTDTELPPMGAEIGVISRIKLLAKLNIAERRLPQDGKIRTLIGGAEYDLRIATTPTIHGENVVVRLLNRSQVKLDFKGLGFDDQTQSRFESILSLPHGVILITGPTGSGKTTTLYTALTRLNQPSTNIITVEDPVEYELAGINQIQVKPEIGLDFSSLLRSIVRHDPDIIMIGEMRDIETVNIAVQSALTGHLVLSTLHTNDAASGLVRLLDMGVDDFLLSSTVTGILAQRLVRKLCAHCKQPYDPPFELKQELKVDEVVQNQSAAYFSAVGCERCQDTGYSGRVAILELLTVSEEIKRLIMQGASSSEIMQAAIKQGMQTLLQDGLSKAAQGLTSLEEVVRLAKSCD